MKPCPRCGQLDMPSVFGIDLDWRRLVVSRNGREVRITRKEMQLLEAMLQGAPGTPMSEQHLRQRIFDGQERGQTSIVVLAGRLRRAIEPLGLGIKSRYGIGWVLIDHPLQEPRRAAAA